MDETIWYKSRGFWIGVFTILAGIIEAILADLNAGIQITLAGVVMIILRIITKTEILFPQKVETVLTAARLK
jgi:uncharacterized membrane protein